MSRSRLVWVGLVLGSVPFVSGAARAQCQPGWSDGFDRPGFSSEVLALLRFDDGSGPALYAGGFFDRIDGVPAPGIGRWDGSSWSIPGSELEGYFVTSFTVFDDGTGPALYAGGRIRLTGSPGFFNTVARWNGTSWTPVGPASTNSNDQVNALCVFDDGNGPTLYAAAEDGGYVNDSVLKWDGSAWIPVGSASDGVVNTLAVHDAGSGPELYAGGSFMTFAGIPAKRIARFDGSAWAEGSDGIGPSGEVLSLISWNDGGGSALYAGGNFGSAGGVPSLGVARWDGTSWSAVSSDSAVGVVQLSALDLGEGPALYAAGWASPFVQQLDGTTWSPVGSGTDGPASCMAKFGSDSGVSLFVGGWFTAAGGVAAAGIASWDGSSWHSNPTTMDGANRTVDTLRTVDVGTGPHLYASGEFSVIGDAVARRVARWDGTHWHALGSGTNDTVNAFAGFDDGTGRKLYAGGTFTEAGGVAANRVARWNGSAWSALASGTNGPVHALAVFEFGGTSALIAGGEFTFASGVSVNRIARWNGSSWSSLGTGADENVYTLAVFNDGSGPALYAAGRFSSIGGVAANGIGRWNGTNWSPLAAGVGPSGVVFSLAVFDDGSGQALYAGGRNLQAGVSGLVNVTRWDGTFWTTVGGNIATRILGLTVFDDGSGSKLCAVREPPGVVRWDGTSSSWSLLPSHFAFDSSFSTPEALAIEPFDAGLSGHPDLYVGGWFDKVGNLGSETNSRNIARWDGCSGPGTNYCFGDGVAAACPCANGGAPGRGCQNSTSTGGARLGASGTTVPDTVVLGASAELPQSLSIFLQGNASVGPLLFGDGLRCAGGSLKRLYTRNAVGGSVSAPTGTDPSITTRSAALGDPIVSGTSRYYQTYYRDPNPAFCPNPPGNTFNVTNGVRIDW